jgi:hypothetical protein
MWKTLDRSGGQNVLLRPAFPTYSHRNQNKALFVKRKTNKKKGKFLLVNYRG